MIDLSTETLISLAEAARLRPSGRKGRPTHISTIHRWISHGTAGVRLESIRLGGARFTSREALQRFGDKLTAGGTSTQGSAANRDTQKHENDDRIEKELDQVGI